MLIPLRFPVRPKLDRRDESDFPAAFAVARGDWAALPDQTSFEDMWAVALAIDGYEVDGLFGLNVCRARDGVAERNDAGDHQETALKLWCRFFLTVRAARHSALEEEEARPLLIARYQALVPALKTDGSVVWVGDGMACAEWNAERWVPNLAELQDEGERGLAACEERLLSDSLRTVEQGTETVLEAVRVRWRSVAEPTGEWGEVRRWSALPAQEELTAAKTSALEDPRFFARCQVCRLRFVNGHMWKPDICQRCASRHWGVIS